MRSDFLLIFSQKYHFQTSFSVANKRGQGARWPNAAGPVHLRRLWLGHLRDRDEDQRIRSKLKFETFLTQYYLLSAFCSNFSACIIGPFINNSSVCNKT